MSGHTVRIFVLNNVKDTASGRTFNFPIIPRVGDYIDVKYEPDPQNHPLESHSGIFEVKKVYIHEVGSTFDAELHVEGNKEMD